MLSADLIIINCFHRDSALQSGKGDIGREFRFIIHIIHQDGRKHQAILVHILRRKLHFDLRNPVDRGILGKIQQITGRFISVQRKIIQVLTGNLKRGCLIFVDRR
jgi:hypothetical protein